MFGYNCGFQKIDAPIQFTTATQGNTVSYVHQTITLTPVADGNVSESNVLASQFPKS